MSQRTPEQLAKKREYQRCYRLSHKEEEAARWSAWLIAHPRVRKSRSEMTLEQRVKKQESDRRYYQARKDDPSYKKKRTARRQAWKAAHPEYKEPLRKHNDEQRTRRRIVDARRHACKRAVAISPTADEAIVRFRNGKRWRCYICGKFVSGSECQIDHIVPLTKGGRHAADNLAPVHPLCNQRKHAKLIHEFVPTEGQLVLC